MFYSYVFGSQPIVDGIPEGSRVRKRNKFRSLVMRDRWVSTLNHAQAMFSCLLVHTSYLLVRNQPWGSTLAQLSSVLAVLAAMQTIERLILSCDQPETLQDMSKHIVVRSW